MNNEHKVKCIKKKYYTEKQQHSNITGRWQQIGQLKCLNNVILKALSVTGIFIFPMYLPIY